MLSRSKVADEIAAFRLKLGALHARYLDGERGGVVEEARSCGDALVCLMEEAPLELREKSTTSSTDLKPSEAVA